MHVYGELVRAQLENLSSAPTPALSGRLWWRTDITGGAAEFDNGSLVSRVLLNNQNIVIGTSGTAGSNARLYRSGTAKLQLTIGSDTTAEGTPSTSLAQLSHALEQYTTGARPAASAGAAGQIILNTTDFTIEFQDGTSWYRQFNGGTASNTQRLVLPANTLTNLNALTRKAGALVYATDSLKAYVDNGTSLVAVGSGSGGSLNYIAANSDFETGVSGWATYLNAAQATPVTGTGGSPTVTFTQSLSSPLRGTASGLLTKGASNLQGQGFSFDFTIDPADQSSILNISFDYNCSSGMVVGPTSDVQVFVYDKTNAVLIAVAPQMLQGNGSSNFHFTSVFQTASNSTSYRLIFHIATTSAVAYTLKVDNVVVGPQVSLLGAPVGDWQVYTPTFVGFTGTAVNFLWRRVGGNVEIIGWCTTSAGTGSTVTVSLPSGLVSSSTLTANTCAGSMLSNASATSPAVAVLSPIVSPNVSVFNIGVTANTSSPGNTGMTPVIGTSISGLNLTMNLSIPIQGWGSSVAMSQDSDTRVVAMRAGNMATSAGGSTDIDFIPTNITSTGNGDTHGAYNTSTGIYTVPVSGWYEIQGSVDLGGSKAAGRYDMLLKDQANATLAEMGCYAPSATIASDVFLTGSALRKFNAGDQFKVRITRSGSVTIGNGDNLTDWLSVKRLTGPSAIASSELVSCSYYNSASPTVNSTPSQLVFNTKLFDTHSAYNNSTGVWTCPVSGKYQVSTYIATNTVSVSGVNNLQGDLRKNGSSVFTPYFPTITSSALNTAPVLTWTYTLQLLAGDLLTYFVSNSNSTTLGSGQTSSSFIVTRLGAY